MCKCGLTIKFENPLPVFQLKRIESQRYFIYFSHFRIEQLQMPNMSS